MFVLFNFLVALAISFIASFMLILAGVSDTTFDTIYDTISNLYILFILLPTISITVRRLHDTGRSGWWYFVTLIPFIGIIYLVVASLLNSDPFPNEYGPAAMNQIDTSGFIECPSCHVYQDESTSECPSCGYNLGFYQAHKEEIIDVKIEEIVAEDDVIELKKSDIVK